MKKIKLLAALLMLGFVLTGCSLFKDKEKTYVHNEVSITAVDGFVKNSEIINVYYYLQKGNEIIIVAKVNKSDVEETLGQSFTMEELLTFEMEAKDLEVEIQTNILDDSVITYVEYEIYDETNQNQLSYLVSVYETEEYFYLVNFTTLTKNYPKKQSNYLSWAHSVVISEE